MPPALRRDLPVRLTKSEARRLWLRAQRLDAEAPFGEGPEAVRLAVEHLGYVQIDTINVVERCHHHILWNRIPAYRRADLDAAQSRERSVFEYWTHALAYVPTRDFRFFAPRMRAFRSEPSPWFGGVTPAERAKALKRVREEGALTIRDVDDDVLVDKHHPWASRKPTKRALQMLFFSGDLTIAARAGMLKTYELTTRHFGWEARPRAASDRQILDYMLDRALRAQGVVGLDSVCYLDTRRKQAMRELIEARVARRRLVPVAIEGAEKAALWAEPAALEARAGLDPASRVHILSPFDPLAIQRRRLALFFDYEHRFEAYLPKEKRVLGYFALPVLVGERIACAFDMKADRAGRRLLLQSRTDFGPPLDADGRERLDEALGRFERFQVGGGDGAEDGGADEAATPPAPS